MRKQLFTYIIPLLVCVCCLSVLPSRVGAQTTVLSQLFKNMNNAADFTDISSFEGWTFENCDANKDTYLRVGSSGTVTSPALGIEGSVVLLIKTVYISSGAKFGISVVGSGTVASTEYTVTSGDYYRPSAILIKGCMPSTQIRVEGTAGSFYIMAIKAFAVSDAVFYESFDYMSGTGGNNGSFGAPSSVLLDKNVNLFDAYSGVGYSDVRPGYMCVEINSNGDYYQTPPISDVTNTMLLSFRVAGTSKSTGTPATIEISGGGTLSQTSFAVTKATWRQYYAVVSDMTSLTRFKFTGEKFFLDDVKLTPIPSGLDQSKDNSTYILANAEQVRTVTLTRSLTPNVWCPLCLPFDVTPNQMASVTGTTCELSAFSSIITSTGVFKFNSVDGESTIAAGSPFLIRTAASVVNPTFTDVTIKNADPVTYTAGGYQFVGIYSPTYLKTDGTNLFLGTDGNLYKPGTDEGYNRLGGMRAYFVVPETASARVVFDEEQVVTGIDNVEEEQGSTVSFDLMGHPVSGKSPRGIIINKGRKWLSK